MATNKNQHYVPRCYLRPFTHDSGNAAINLFNVDRDKLIIGAPVKNQCSGSYFYGDDPALEKAIQSMEGAYATTLRTLLIPGYALNDHDRWVLKRFWLLQYLRTEAASQRFVSMSNDMADGVGPGAENMRFQLREAVQLSMRTFVRVGHTVDDLKLCLVRNRTPLPFVTSDDPAVLTNRWHFVDRRAFSRAFGLAASGCLTLMPLSPTLLCVGYDGDVYSIPHTNGWTEVRRVTDVMAFNQHQFLNCRANIYLGEARNIEDVRTQWAAAAPLRPSARHEIEFAVKDGDENGYERYRAVSAEEARKSGQALIRFSPIQVCPRAWPQLIQWRPKGSVYTNGSAAGYVRRAHIQPDTRKPFREECARPT